MAIAVIITWVIFERRAEASGSPVQGHVRAGPARAGPLFPVYSYYYPLWSFLLGWDSLSIPWNRLGASLSIPWNR